MTSATEIRVLAEDEDNQPLILSSRIASVESVMRASHPLDYCGTRRALRFDLVDDVQLAVNGEPGRLVNLSFAGAQLVLPVRIRPEEALRITLTEAAAEDGTRVRGVVAWCTVEPTGPHDDLPRRAWNSPMQTHGAWRICASGTAARRTGQASSHRKMALVRVPTTDGAADRSTTKTQEHDALNRTIVSCVSR